MPARVLRESPRPLTRICESGSPLKVSWIVASVSEEEVECVGVVRGVRRGVCFIDMFSLVIRVSCVVVPCAAGGRGSIEATPSVLVEVRDHLFSNASGREDGMPSVDMVCGVW